MKTTRVLSLSLLTASLVALGGACHKSGSGGSAAAAKLTAHLPKDSMAVVGYNRSGSAADAKKLFDGATKAVAQTAPSCAGDVFAAVDHVVVGVPAKSANEDNPDATIVIHGKNLQATVESCFKKVFKDYKKVTSGQATGYTTHGETQYVVWLDGDTAILGTKVGKDAAKTAALAKVAGGPPASLMKHADTSAIVWASVDLTKIPQKHPNPMFAMPSAVWASVTKSTGKLAFAFKSADDAKKDKAALDMLKAGMVPPKYKDVVDAVKIDLSGSELSATVDLKKLSAALEKATGKKFSGSNPLGAIAAAALPMMMRREDSAPPDMQAPAPASPAAPMKMAPVAKPTTK